MLLVRGQTNGVFSRWNDLPDRTLKNKHSCFIPCFLDGYRRLSVHFARRLRKYAPEEPGQERV